jgi:aminoglycoside 2''-phosphotransferase
MNDEALADAALKAFREAMPGEAVAAVETITRGWDSLALLVNGRWLLRAARRPEVGATLALEARLLPLIAASVAPARVPNFIMTRFETEPAVVGYEAIQGHPLSLDDLELEARAETLATQLAEFLTALHSMPSERAAVTGTPHRTVEDWRAEYVAFRDWSRVKVAPRLAPDVRDRLEGLWGEYLDAPASFQFTPVLAHRDLACEHILLADNGALAGVIDWGDASLGDPAIDFAGLLDGLGEGFTRRVIARWRGPRAASETDATLLTRAVFYLRLAPLHAIRFGLLTGAGAYTRRGLADLTRALSDGG